MKVFSAICLLILSTVTWAQGKLTIEITEGIDNPIQIAVVPFKYGSDVAVLTDIADIIGKDLLRSGQFAPISRNSMLSTPHRVEDVFFRDWRAIGAEYTVVGKLEKGLTPDQLVLSFAVVDIHQQQQILKLTVAGDSNKPRAIAHLVADKIHEQITGIAGAFSSRILYVSSDQEGERYIYRLHIADTDGYNEKILLKSSEPILSPAWSPDAKEVAYVSFESKKPAIYRHVLATSQRQKLVDFPGLNGAPAWSPDGKSMALVLSKDGSPDIYTLDLATLKLKKVVSHFAIDTEPSWLPNGKELLFTSDRSGNPQVYKVNVESGAIQRVTFEGKYNARPQVLPDGSGFVVITRRSDRFHIALQRFDTDRIFILSQTALDESPTVAPNGFMLLYATKFNEQGILAAVSIDGGIKFRLPSSSTNVRDPAWSPI